LGMSFASICSAVLEHGVAHSHEGVVAHQRRARYRALARGASRSRSSAGTYS
jgi:ATP-dependent DNA ligase